MGQTDYVSTIQSAELAVFEVLTRHLGHRRMIDVGAHHGSTLLPFLEAGWDVVAFEPMEDNCRRLLARCGPSPRLTVRREAVSDRVGTADFHTAVNLDGTQHEFYHSLERIRSDRYHRKGPVIRVPVVTLDDLAAEGTIPAEVGFLKIDTEGHDLAVLRGAGRLTCDVVGVEFWGDELPLGTSPSPAPEMIALMNRRGYGAYVALCHHGEATVLLDSRFDGVPGSAWGNILFFHDRVRSVHADLCQRLSGTVPTAFDVKPDDRLLGILRLAFPAAERLVAVRDSDLGDGFDGTLHAGFPGSKCITPSELSAEPVHVIRCGNPAVLLDVLRSVGPKLVEDGPLVLARVVLETSDGQATIAAAVRLLGHAGYALSGFWNLQASEEGLCARADLLFLPAALAVECHARRGVVSYADSAHLLAQARELQRTCDERLRCLEKVHEIAENRLAHIERLDTELRGARDASHRRLRAIREIGRRVRTARRHLARNVAEPFAPGGSAARAPD